MPEVWPRVRHVPEALPSTDGPKAREAFLRAPQAPQAPQANFLLVAGGIVVILVSSNRKQSVQLWFWSLQIEMDKSNTSSFSRFKLHELAAV